MWVLGKDGGRVGVERGLDGFEGGWDDDDERACGTKARSGIAVMRSRLE
jgi:hypothetical protein